MPAIQIDRYSLVIDRSCQECGRTYRIQDYVETSESSFQKPIRYIDGCEQFCLSCWLGVGPNDSDHVTLRADPVAPPSTDLCVDVPRKELRDGRHHVIWPYDDVYESLLQGNLLDGFQWFFRAGWHLAVLPIARVKLGAPVFFPNGGAIYPPQVAQLDALNPRSNRKDSESREEVCSAESGVDIRTFERQSLVVIPCRFPWDEFVESGHQEHLRFIRSLSELIDLTFLNFMRYRGCRLDSTDCVPGRAGQTRDNPRMSGALVYNGATAESRIVGGAVFPHAITSGLGMAFTQPEWNEMPAKGDVGRIAEHAFFLYSNLLETPSLSAKFMQAVGLLEYLAFPFEYRPLKKVRAVVVRYSARTPEERDRLTRRFQNDLFGPNGYRTQIVHNGKRLEDLLPSQRDRLQLFKELEGYIRPIINDMLTYSQMAWNEYAEHRKHLGFGLPGEDE
jgi:hypothetical protein